MCHIFSSKKKKQSGCNFKYFERWVRDFFFFDHLVIFRFSVHTYLFQTPLIMWQFTGRDDETHRYFSTSYCFFFFFFLRYNSMLQPYFISFFFFFFFFCSLLFLFCHQDQVGYDSLKE